jgi:hypothetical protein
MRVSNRHPSWFGLACTRPKQMEEDGLWGMKWTATGRARLCKSVRQALTRDEPLYSFGLRANMMQSW